VALSDFVCVEFYPLNSEDDGKKICIFYTRGNNYKDVSKWREVRKWD